MPLHLGSICGAVSTAPPKPSVQTRFVLDAMASEAEQENTKLDHIMESLDLLFERVTDIGIQQQHMKKQIDDAASTAQQQSPAQQHMASKLAETGRAVAKLTMEKMKKVESVESDIDYASDGSLVLKHFHKKEQSTSKNRKDHHEQNTIPKHHVPKVFCPNNGDNPVIWKDKCIDYFLLVDLEPKH
jgi:hypothetical protein